MTKQTTEQQDTREQRLADIVTVTGHAEWCDHEDPDERCICNALGHAAALLDGPVARMIADAEQAAERRWSDKLLRMERLLAQYMDWLALMTEDYSTAMSDLADAEIYHETL